VCPAAAVEGGSSGGEGIGGGGIGGEEISDGLERPWLTLRAIGKHLTIVDDLARQHLDRQLRNRQQQHQNLQQQQQQQQQQRCDTALDVITGDRLLAPSSSKSVVQFGLPTSFPRLFGFSEGRTQSFVGERFQAEGYFGIMLDGTKTAKAELRDGDLLVLPQVMGPCNECR
jgi:hypothetical protein